MSYTGKILIASKNPVKIECTRTAFKQVFPDRDFEFEGYSVSSDVSDQPMTDEETYLGAYNRAGNLKAKYPEADFWVGIEGGIEDHNHFMNAFAWMVIMDKHKLGEARTATFPLPERIRELIGQGMELGHADDRVFQRKNSKQKDGAVGILTHGLIDRARYYEHALILALIPFLNKDLF